MDPFTLAVLAAAALATLAVVAAALRRPVLWRMAVRNALRRPRQTATVVAGLMVGTAIISSALVANDSASNAVRGYVYQSLGEVDASVAVQGYPFFPQSAADALAADPAVQAAFDGVAANVVWQGTGEAPRTGLFEPNVALVGYPPEADRAFGTFRRAGGAGDDGAGLRPGQAIATKRLADALGLRPGDRAAFSFVLPIDPILPDVAFLNGTASDPGPALAGLPAPAPPPAHAIPVGRGATLLLVLLPPDLRLRATLTAPNGTAYALDGAGAHRLDVTAPPGRTLPAGEWRLAVAARGASGVPYTAVAVVGTPVFDAARLQERAAALRDAPPALRALLPGLDPGRRHTANFTVAMVSDGGRADLFDLRDALFVRLDEAQAILHRPGQVNLVKLSQPGDRVEGEAATDAALPVLRDALAAVQAAHPDVAAVQHLEAKPLKREFLAQADAKGATLAGLLVFAASLSIITGLLLILNIFTMLAEERRGETGMARAVGLSRADLVRLSVFEGSLYAVAAAAAGALLGLGLAYAMVQAMNAVVARLSRDLSFPPIEYHPSPAAFLVALGLGAVLTLATILGASARQSRLNVVRAIRRLDEPETAPRRGALWAAGLALAVAALAASAVAWMPGSAPLFFGYGFTAQVALPLVAGVGAGLALRPLLSRRLLVPLLAGLLAAYYAATFFLVREFEDRGEANVVGPLRGVLMALALVAVAVHLEAPLRFAGRALARLRPLRPLALPALSYPLHRKFRTGMTLAMFSVVILSIGFFSIFGALFQTDPARQAGGFAVEARATLAVPDLAAHDQGLPSVRAAVAGAVELAEIRSEDRGFITVNGTGTGTFRDYRHVVYGYGASFAQAQQFALIDRLPGYATDTAAYAGVLARRDQAIVSYVYSTSPDGQAFAHRAGDALEVHLGNQTLRYTIAGIQEQYHFPGVFLPRGEVDALFPSAGRLYLYRLSPGADAQAVARDLERNYRDVGLDARSTIDEVLEEQASFRQMLGAMKLFLGLGLVVGVLSLGIVTSRSVLERRQEIGMMRALGYTGRQVRRVFLLEVTATILMGTVVGIACALVVTYGLWFAVVRELNYPYVVPWGEIGLLVLVSYVVAIAATWAPIGRTAKVAPAEALRYAE